MLQDSATTNWHRGKMKKNFVNAIASARGWPAFFQKQYTYVFLQIYLYIFPKSLFLALHVKFHFVMILSLILYLFQFSNVSPSLIFSLFPSYFISVHSIIFCYLLDLSYLIENYFEPSILTLPQRSWKIVLQHLLGCALTGHWEGKKRPVHECSEVSVLLQDLLQSCGLAGWSKLMRDMGRPSSQKHWWEIACRFF